MSDVKTKYALLRELPETPLAEARQRVTEALAREGFGILTEIDVRDTLKKKLDVDFRPYVILGACNPELAHQGLKHEPYLGLLLPCNVVLSEREGGGTVISAMDPYVLVKVAENMALEDLAHDARQRLSRALAGL